MAKKLTENPYDTILPPTALDPYNAKLEFGRDVPFGGSVAFNHTDLTYLNTTDPSLINSKRGSVRLGLRFDLTEAIRLTAAASTLRLQEVSAPTRRTNTFSLGLQNARENGNISADLSLTDTSTGYRASLSFGRSYDLPTGQLNASIGVSSSVSGGGCADRQPWLATGFAEWAAFVDLGAKHHQQCQQD